jgi:hypothetical protein
MGLPVRLLFVARTATRLSSGFLEVMLNGFPGSIPVLSSLPGLELACSSELAKIIHRGVEEGSQFVHGQEVYCAFHTCFQVEIEGVFHGKSDEAVDMHLTVSFFQRCLPYGRGHRESLANEADLLE